MRFVVYLDGTALDMFQDESVVLSRRVKDLRDLKSVVSDYSQSFKVPASTRNNKAFKHYYNVDVVGGYDAHNKTPAVIEIDGIEVFNGVVELNSVTFKDGQPQDYSIVFYGDNKKLSSSMGEDTLQAIQWDDYTHARTSQNITNSWNGNLLSGKVMYPVIAWGEAFNYSSAGTSISKNIATSTGGVTISDLKPALLLTEMVKAIFTHYGYDSQGSFYTNSHLDDLYVCPSAYAGTLNVATVVPKFEVSRATTYNFGMSNFYVTMTYTAEALDTVNAMNYTSGTFTAPTAGLYSFTNSYYVATTQSGTIASKLYKNGSSVANGNTHTTTGNKTDSFAVTLAAGDLITMRYSSTQSGAQISNITFECTSGPNTSSNTNINFGELMPKVKVAEFLNGVLQTFNCILLPISDSRIDVEPLKDWYDNGATKDWSKYADISSVVHKKVDVAKRLSFKHKKSTDFQNQAFTQNAVREFGSSESSTSVDFGSKDLKVQSPFQVFPPTLIRDINQYGSVASTTDIQLFQALDNGLNPIQINFLLFYYNGLKSSDDWYFGGSLKTSFPIISPYNAYPTASTSRSLAFSLESTLSGDAPEKTILSEFWLGYISRIYSSQSRLVELTLRLPVGQWLDLDLSETINISGYYYKIDGIQYDMLKEEAKVTLMTYPDINIYSASSTGNNWNVGTPSANNNGITFVGTGSQGTSLGNINTVNGTRTTQQPNAPSVPFVVVSNIIASAYESEVDTGGGGTEEP